MRQEASQFEPQRPLLEVRNLEVHFPVTAGFFQRVVGTVKAVDDVSLTIRQGETFAVVGESGSGKTTLGRAILQLTPPTSGEVVFQGKSLNGMARSEVRAARREMQMIFQDPYSSLNPRMPVGRIVGEPLRIHRLVKSTQQWRDRVAEILTLVGLTPDMASRYPHEFSGGQRQRVGIARALAVNPSFVVCDEPVSALDVSIQAQIIGLLEDLREQLHLTYLFISHDLSVVRHIADRVAVMYLGHTVEVADQAELFDNPRHPYTRALLAAAPVPDPRAEARRERIIISGEMPSPMNPPVGCVFHTRCPLAIDACKEAVPALRNVGPDHTAACILV